MGIDGVDLLLFDPIARYAKYESHKIVVAYPFIKLRDEGEAVRERRRRGMTCPPRRSRLRPLWVEPRHRRKSGPAREAAIAEALTWLPRVPTLVIDLYLIFRSGLPAKI